MHDEKAFRDAKRAILANAVRCPENLPATIHAQYEIVSCLRNGGFGMVLAARLRSSPLSPEVAIKILYRDSVNPDQCRWHPKFGFVPDEVATM